jgi:hypothetical protein
VVGIHEFKKPREVEEEQRLDSHTDQRDQRLVGAGTLDPSREETKVIDPNLCAPDLPGRTQLKAYDNLIKFLNPRVRRHCEV